MTTRTRGRLGALLAAAGAALLLAAGPVRAAQAGKTPNPNNGHGKITAVSATSITVTPKNGTAKTFGITTATKVRLDGQPANVADLAVGEHAQVKSQDGTTARRILARTHVKKGKGKRLNPIAPAPLP
ncbi:MAG: hypothetical protein JO250_05650 [Armatimonadetes bacterium]|nr:hypothetical protein [Armatimonadota bacterium]